MLSIPETKKGVLVLMNKATMDLIRAVERDKLRKAFMSIVMKKSNEWEKIVKTIIDKWPQRQSAFYRN